MYINLICLSNGCVTDHQGRMFLGDYQLISRLGVGGYGQVILVKKRSTASCSSSKDLFVMKSVCHRDVAKVEKEVMLQAVGSPFLMHLIQYFETMVSCSFKHSMSMH
jgi:serine/threonine protein kinase